MAKLSLIDSAEDYQYGNVYAIESGKGWSRLKIGPNADHIQLLDKLSSNWSTPEYYLLYVSLVSHTGKKQGRYQSGILSKDDLDIFLYTHIDFLQKYGGQHLWIGHPQSNDLLIYDQHNYIYAYGNISGYINTLNSLKYREGDFSIPCPHSHSFDPDLTQFEDDLFNHFEWAYSELREGDEY